MKSALAILLLALVSGCASLDTTYHPYSQGPCVDAGGFCGAPCPEGFSCQTEVGMAINPEKSPSDGRVVQASCHCIAKDYKSASVDGKFNVWELLGVGTLITLFVFALSGVHF